MRVEVCIYLFVLNFACDLECDIFHKVIANYISWILLRYGPFHRPIKSNVIYTSLITIIIFRVYYTRINRIGLMLKLNL